ncbi:hypothetical protein RND71_020499 [Anisodus tanguticus]|uniref:Isopenicillin N synthase-like Fe(2+) 2OG dioxygenase domain-containing protein n=1 Tax=Anisodus tanguticus TaxID=243964 RepID=A0AAE1S2N0_9SOLA|nr:hypothetical protein RND71_020499 [Anisodus tanguticus]
MVNHGIPTSVLDELRKEHESFLSKISSLRNNHIGGLQVLHRNQWIDVPPTTPSALVVNIGDFLEAITHATVQKSYDKMSELKAFDDTKADVKGLVDAGITKVPQIYILPPKNRPESSNTCETRFTFQVIDLKASMRI